MPDTLGGRGVASIAQLLAGATARRPYKTVDSLSGSRLEQVDFGERILVLKVLSAEHDWLMRAIGDAGGRQAALFSSGVLDGLRGCIDHTVVGVAADTDPGGRPITALLMRDVSTQLIAAGDGVVALDTHRRLLEHMAAIHAAYWEWSDSGALLPLERHYTFLGPEMARREVQRSPAPVPRAVALGWKRLLEVSPVAGRLATALAANPAPLVAALRTTPQTLVHGDWKFGNLGEHGDGRRSCSTGTAPAWPAAPDLGWYLAVNCDRLPESKEASVDAYASALGACRIDTSRRWDRQLRLALLGTFVQLGWSKADGDAAERGWWEDRVTEGRRELA